MNLFESIAFQERENNESLKNEICKLQEEINSLKSCHYLDNQKMKLLIANLEDNLSKEAESVKIETSKNSQLKKNIDNERELVQILKQEVMTIQEKLKQEQMRCRDEEYHKETFEKALQEEKNNIEKFKKKIVEGQHQIDEDTTAMKDKIRDMQLEIQQLLKQVHIEIS